MITEKLENLYLSVREKLQDEIMDTDERYEKLWMPMIHDVKRYLHIPKVALTINPSTNAICVLFLNEIMSCTKVR